MIFYSFSYVMALKVNSMFIGMTLVILGGHGAWLWVQQRKDIVGNEGGKEFPLITVNQFLKVQQM